MPTRDADKMLDEYLKGGSRVSKVYRDDAAPEPPDALDRAILDAAHQAAKTRRSGFNPFGGRWVAPLSAAAMVAIAVGLTIFMQREGVTPIAETPPAVQEPRALGERLDAPAQRRTIVGNAGVTEEIAAPSEGQALRQRAEVPAVKAPVAADRIEALPTAESPERVLGAATKMAKEEQIVSEKGADVLAVQVSGQAGNYQFSVTVRSPDTGCAQYANWWEVLSTDGRLRYRRVLLHSHVTEQPFTRSGGPVPIQPTDTVIVRAHMNVGGYSGTALKGSVNSGFAPAALPPDFAADAAKKPPLPESCMY